MESNRSHVYQRRASPYAKVEKLFGNVAVISSVVYHEGSIDTF